MPLPEIACARALAIVDPPSRGGWGREHRFSPTEVFRRVDVKERIESRGRKRDAHIAESRDKIVHLARALIVEHRLRRRAYRRTPQCENGMMLWAARGYGDFGTRAFGCQK